MDVPNIARSEPLHTRVNQLNAEARALGSTLEATVRDVEKTLRAQLEERPYRTLAAAVGVGYVLGGGLPSRVTTLLLAIGGRVLMEAAVRDMTARLSDASQ